MARGIGANCAVLDECRRYALDTAQLHGIWGGLTEPERAECAEKCCCTTTAADIRAPSVSAF
ncbi:WhiB family transcriptional regulator [Rhodococcus sp. T2V]|uniref:WhiB family transcriptional regulator n=1 Tax=Rhodococcus sp. T2V TaxID=3034164 RepID=UPI0023E143E9|nr:WhiB family transcriptional regulator [Rhodococcus sp. T2V]MDF3309605.1 WhiB family transcriptional regulator [Rhodococcus sp. T2V]